MDTTAFFDYPTLASVARDQAAGHGLEFLPGATGEEWATVLAATETLRFHAGDVVLRAGERDRALYLLLDGQLERRRIRQRRDAPATIGSAAFLDAQPRAVTLVARTHGELARMSWEAYRSARRTRRATGPRAARRPCARPGRAAADGRRRAAGLDRVIR